VNLYLLEVENLESSSAARLNVMFETWNSDIAIGRNVTLK
jgi:hypothetical protein